MAKLVVHNEKVEDAQALVDLCPFGAIELSDKGVKINDLCRMCMTCVRRGPAGAVELVEDKAPKPQVDKSAWRDVAV